MKKEKYYVVWAGVSPGIYTSWTDCQLQTKGYEGAKYKSFESREEAEKAFASSPYAYIKRSAPSPAKTIPGADAPLPAAVAENSLAVDAACSGNPGAMEYRGVHVASRQEIFHFGPMYGTNNIGEFLAIVHGLALLKQKGFDMPIYSDSGERHQLDKTEKMQNQTAARRQDRRAFLPNRTCGKVVARKHLHHPHPEMGDKTMGRDSGRLRKEVKKRGTPDSSSGGARVKKMMRPSL